MTYDELFKLYEKVQAKDKEAMEQLRAEHARVFPTSYFRRFDFNNRPQFMHTMYLHLTQKKKNKIKNKNNRK